MHLTSTEKQAQPTLTLGSATTFGVNDTMRYGLVTASDKLMKQHPLKMHLQQAASKKSELQIMRNIYGLHAPLRLKMERAILNQPHRIPVMKNSHFGLNTLNGSYMDINFEDFLGDQEYCTDSLDVHAAMEHTLNL
ncbi:hypothetical protein HDU92_002387 [Lobulomyces angularis]|nr:hypothetical protein HDU92_002387 [Lobulomyces angularis]